MSLVILLMSVTYQVLVFFVNKYFGIPTRTGSIGMRTWCDRDVGLGSVWTEIEPWC